jgi:hypothetical protein
MTQPSLQCASPCCTDGGANTDCCERKHFDRLLAERVRLCKEFVNNPPYTRRRPKAPPTTTNTLNLLQQYALDLLCFSRELAEPLITNNNKIVGSKKLLQLTEYSLKCHRSRKFYETEIIGALQKKTEAEKDGF